MEIFQNKLRRESTIKVRASIVIRLIDSFTGKAPIEKGLSLVVNNLKKQPLKKPGGFYIVIDLEPGDYIIKIKSENYIEETQVVSVHENMLNEEVFPIMLNPSVGYSNHYGNTCIRFAIKDDHNINNKDLTVTATIHDLNCAIAKLAQDYSAGSDRKVNIVKTGQISVGDYLLITQKTKDISEHCIISELDNDGQSLILEQPLSNDYKRGSLFLPIIKTKVNNNREGLLILRNYQLKSYELTLEVKCEEVIIEKKLVVKEGHMLNIGKL